MPTGRSRVRVFIERVGRRRGNEERPKLVTRAS